MDEREIIKYRVGALMYVPALTAGIGEKLCAHGFPGLNALAFCLEDAVAEAGLLQAERQLAKTLSYIERHEGAKLPLLFIRVRDCAQFKRLHAMLGSLVNLLSGVIFPKFDLSNAAEYCTIAGNINSKRATPLYAMPVLESESIMRLSTRERTLLGLRELLDGCKDFILNIRVGAMDFCKPYGLRRSVLQSVYDIAPVRDALSDILTTFADSYVVSAPVWEYFEGASADNSWVIGMENELRLDVANGFVGKTVIHPSQIQLVKKWLAPTRADVSDAKAVLNWKAGAYGVEKSAAGNRMNELATHRKWAQKIMILSEIYGERDV